MPGRDSSALTIPIFSPCGDARFQITTVILAKLPCRERIVSFGCFKFQTQLRAGVARRTSFGIKRRTKGVEFQKLGRDFGSIGVDLEGLHKFGAHAATIRILACRV